MAVPGPPASVQEPPCQEQWSDQQGKSHAPLSLGGWTGMAVCPWNSALRADLPCNSLISPLPSMVTAIARLSQHQPGEG